MKKQLASVLAVFVVLTTVFSCTKIDNGFGEDYIPDSQRMRMVRDTFSNLGTYYLTIDSIVSSDWTYGFLGSIIDEVYGKTDCGIIGQVVPAAFLSSDSLWGDLPVIDSVFLYIEAATGIGDTTYHQKISLYELETFYHKDTSYYSNIGNRVQYNPVPIAQFEQKISQGYAKVPIPVHYMTKYLDTTGGIYRADSLFIRKHLGYVLKAETAQSAGGSLLQPDYQNMNFLVYYHNKNTPNPDTTYMELQFYNGYGYINKNITTIEHDYTYANPSRGGVDIHQLNDTLNTADVVYVQGLAGLMSYVEIPQTMLDKIKADVRSKGYDPAKISVNKALLTTPVAQTSNERLDQAVDRLGMYLDFHKLNTIPDYNVAIETQITIPFDGYFNRSLKHYSMDISSYIQRLLQDKYSSNRVYLTSSIADASLPNYVALNGTGSAKPMQLIITYTMIK